MSLSLLPTTPPSSRKRQKRAAFGVLSPSENVRFNSRTTTPDKLKISNISAIGRVIESDNEETIEIPRLRLNSSRSTNITVRRRVTSNFPVFEEGISEESERASSLEHSKSRPEIFEPGSGGASCEDSKKDESKESEEASKHATTVKKVSHEQLHNKRSFNEFSGTSSDFMLPLGTRDDSLSSVNARSLFHNANASGIELKSRTGSETSENKSKTNSSRSSSFVLPPRTTDDSMSVANTGFLFANDRESDFESRPEADGTDENENKKMTDDTLPSPSFVLPANKTDDSASFTNVEILCTNQNRSVIETRFERDTDENANENITKSSRDSSKASSECSMHPSTSLNTPIKGYDFQYPENVSPPAPSLLNFFHDYSLSQNIEQRHIPCSKTLLPDISNHQESLSKTFPHKLSLEEVILPAVAQMELQALKACQASAQKYKDASGTEVIKTIETCRKVVVKSCMMGVDAARKNRMERENKRLKEKQRRQECRKKKRQERMIEIQKRHLKKRQMKSKKKAMERLEKKKNLPCNREMWREVALLMTDVARLQKEKKAWLEAKRIVEKNQDQIKIITEMGDDVDSDSNDEDDVDKTIETIFEDITFASHRINRALQDVMKVAKESEKVKDEMFTLYTEKLQHRGYKGVRHPDELLRNISFDGSMHSFS
eukprot:CAMPEP_0172499670 /NCGR_PEP_ID=MMETSP1066-20121228/129431_1 /TAXON_ID=671091 /ORGANISM="Coscinodiscus wailesii, Strain CCMP2513" /LENGTH=661 /DNA_ID=CAMNT_0013273543 /DNA_START=76 /DNA_END=2061 /DNA_ORIENTATION=-